MKLVARNFEKEPYEFIVEPWAMPVEVLPGQELHVIGTGSIHAEAPELSLYEKNQSFGCIVNMLVSMIKKVN